MSSRDWTNTDRMISDRLQSYWVAYAYNGSLNAPGLPRWPSFNNAPTLRCIWRQERPGTGVDSRSAQAVRHAAIALQRFLKGEARGDTRASAVEHVVFRRQHVLSS
jgi:hypothetical protein